MSHDLNTGCPSNSTLCPPEDEFTGRFEDLIEGLERLDGFSPEEAADALTASAPELCPKPDEWLRVATGEAGPADMEALLTHAAVCRDCSARLRHCLRLHCEEASPEEAAEVERQASASAGWQRQLATELASTPMKAARKKATGPYLWAGAAMAASLAIAVGLSAWWLHVSAPERLLAEAYTHSRSFDLRIPGAGYAEVTSKTHLRGGSTSREPSGLLDARTRIEHQLESSPQNPHWLQLEARSEILDGRFDPAIDILDRLLAAGPVTSSLLVDDATAYFQRGSYSGSEIDRAKALDDLRQADELAPGNPVVLFNEALVMEDRGQAMNAVETWNRYLRFERDPHWLAEGRRRMEALKLKLNPLKMPQSRN